MILRRRCTPQSPPPSVQWKPRWAIFKSTILPTSSPGCCPICPQGTTLSSYVKVGDCFKGAAWPSGLCVGLVSGHPGYESRSDPVCGFVMGRPEFISSATFVNRELFASSRLEFLILLPTWGNPDSAILEIFACGIWNPGPWNPECSCRNPESQWLLESRIQVPLKKIWNPLPGIRNPESKTVLDSLRLRFLIRFCFIWFICFYYTYLIGTPAN